MENGPFAPMEQILHFPYYFQIYDISKVSKCIIMEKRVKCLINYGLILTNTNFMCFLDNGEES